MDGLFSSVRRAFRKRNLVYSSALFLCSGIALANSDDISITSSVSNSSLASGNIATVTYTVTTMNGQNASDIEFVASLPAGQVIDELPFASSTCFSGNLSAVPGSDSFTASSYRLGSDSSCTFSFNVEVTQTGNIVSSGFNSSLGTAADTSETITVNANAVSVGLTASPELISAGNISTLTLDFTNPTGSMVFTQRTVPRRTSRRY